MNAGRTARERARAEVTREIKDEARRQLATVGADGLSLRAVARELGMVSSALYRYFAGRDELLTALIVDAYGSLADALDAADRRAADRRAADRRAADREAVGGLSTGDPDPSARQAAPGEVPRRRFRAVCAEIRRWARARPHEYALIYGSPVPGYRAPRVTVEPAARIPLLMLDIARAGRPGTPDPGPPMSAELAGQLGTLRERFAPDLPAPTLAGALMAWTQVFGIVSFELVGQLVGSVDPTDGFFAYAVERTADQLGLPPAPGE